MITFKNKSVPENRISTTDAAFVNTFTDTVEAALISGAASQLDKLLKQASAHNSPISISRTCLIVAQICQKHKRTKQVRCWLERLVTQAAQEEIMPAISVAVSCGHASLALYLYNKWSKEVIPAPAEGLAIIRDTVALARRLRQPRGRNGCWATHRKLLRIACELQDIMVPYFAPSDLKTEAQRYGAEARTLLGIAGKETGD